MPQPASPVEILTAPSKLQRHVFVYGTLRFGDDNDITRLRPSPRFIGAALIRGVMHHLGTYPGVILAQPEDLTSAMVVGEVYAIDTKLEQVIDEIEELYPQQKDEYFKRHIQVEVGLEQIDCIVYEINPVYVTGKPIITSGDWVKCR